MFSFVREIIYLLFGDVLYAKEVLRKYHLNNGTISMNSRVLHNTAS